MHKYCSSKFLFIKVLFRLVMACHQVQSRKAHLIYNPQEKAVLDLNYSAYITSQEGKNKPKLEEKKDSALQTDGIALVYAVEILKLDHSNKTVLPCGVVTIVFNPVSFPFSRRFSIAPGFSYFSRFPPVCVCAFFYPNCT